MKFIRKILFMVMSICLAFFTLSFTVLRADSIEENETGIDERHGGLDDYTELYGLQHTVDQQQVKPNPYLRSTTTNVGYIAIFIEFPDMVDTSLDDAATLANAEAVMNGDNISMTTGLGTGRVLSLGEYIRKYSYQKLNVTTKFFPQDATGKTISYMAPKPRSYYMPKSSTNPDGYTSGERYQRETELVEGALQAAKPQIEKAYSAEQIDSGNDGVVDAISFFAEAKKAFEDEVKWSDLLWSHKIENTLSTKLNGKTVSRYNFINTYDSKSAGGIFTLNRSSYGTIVHEYLHTCGMPDLYRGYAAGEPVGFYDIMAGTESTNPQPFLAILSSEVVNWKNKLPTIKQSTDSVTITKPTYTSASEKTAVKIISPFSDKEYFIAEYYSMPAFITSVNHAEKDGLFLYRVNTDRTDGNINGAPGQQNDLIYVFRPGDTTVNEGAGDLKKAVLNTSNASYGVALGEEAGKWDPASLYYSNGSNSGIRIKVLSQTDGSVTFSIKMPENIQGAGTEDSPYLISSIEHLQLIEQKPDKYFKLTSDLDFIDQGTIKPITYFSGHFDGNGKTIRNVTIHGEGFFAETYGNSIIKNLTFENINVEETNGFHAGTVIGTQTGTLQNVVVKSGTVKSSVTNEKYRGVGGLVGTLTDIGVIDNCYSSAEVLAGSSTGGLLGLNQNGLITNSYANGVVHAGGVNTGGFIGEVYLNGTDYKKPLNCYYDTKKTQQAKAFGDSAGQSGDIFAYSLDEEVTIDGKKTSEVPVPFLCENPNVHPSLTSKDEKVTKVHAENMKLQGIGSGNTIMTLSFKVGTHDIVMESKVTVENMTDAYPITDIKLDKSSVTLIENDTVQLNAQVFPSQASQKIIWKSENDAIAGVDTTGKITGKSVGKTVVTATAVNGQTAQCSVEVKKREIPITQIMMSSGALTLTEGDIQTLSVSIEPAHTTMSKQINWSTSNSQIVQVNNGRIQAIKPGKAVIEAKSVNGKTTSCIVTVNKKIIPITSIILSNTSVNMMKAETMNISANVYPENTTMSKTIVWFSENSNIAQVDAAGNIHAISSGSTTITAKSENGVVARCSVSVQENKKPSISNEPMKRAQGFYKLSRRVRVFSSPNAANYNRYDPFKKRWLGSMKKYNNKPLLLTREYVNENGTSYWSAYYNGRWIGYVNSYALKNSVKKDTYFGWGENNTRIFNTPNPQNYWLYNASSNKWVRRMTGYRNRKFTIRRSLARPDGSLYYSCYIGNKWVGYVNSWGFQNQ